MKIIIFSLLFISTQARAQTYNNEHLSSYWEEETYGQEHTDALQEEEEQGEEEVQGEDMIYAQWENTQE